MPLIASGKRWEEDGGARDGLVSCLWNRTHPVKSGEKSGLRTVAEKFTFLVTVHAYISSFILRYA